MYNILKGHAFENEIQTVTQLFYQNEGFLPADGVAPEGVTAVSALEGGTCRSQIFVNGVLMGEDVTVIAPSPEYTVRQYVKLSMFDALVRATGFTPTWGALTGIRPTKLVNTLLKSGMTREQAVARLTGFYRASREKAELAAEIAGRERAVIEKGPADGYSLYIGIPFCPTRCVYCSFTSFPIAKYANRISAYLDALEKEAAFVAQSKSGTPQTLYIGGGTPTSLPAADLERLFDIIGEYFDIGRLAEFSVEAGRPDTLDGEKLALLKRRGAGRISVNPQTMHDATLTRIGRNHTVRQFLDTFRAAREAGHDNINIDLILGLPGERAEHVRSTFERVAPLSAENVTVHTLAVKRAAIINQGENEIERLDLAGAGEMERMLAVSREAMKTADMYPYYMYRQKNMIGNFENVGYCKPGRECVYNVEIMQEERPVIALGAGGATKLVDRAAGRIERVFNVYDAELYISRIDEMIERKRRHPLFI